LDAEQDDSIAQILLLSWGQFAGGGAGVAEGVGWADDGQRDGRTRRRRYRKRIAMRTRPPMKI
jgi:hypothetical protein